MLTSKRTTLKPLLESAEGVHLTVYLVNRGDLVDLKSQLSDAINQSYEWLNPVMSAEERNKFLEPLDSLLLDGRIFKQMRGNIGIFRNRDLFRVLNIPIEVEQTCQVASTFHVKPILKWLQNDQEFLLLGLTTSSAHLYLGSQDSFKLVDSILFSELLKGEDTFSWLNDWISTLAKHSKPKLFLAGDRTLIENMNRTLQYRYAVKTPILNSFSKNAASDLCIIIRKILKDDSKDLIERALLEFRFAEEGNRTRKNLFQISRAVVRGQVQKLIVTDELNIFGKIDKKSGALAIHPFDLDHEDDDILDDLAQLVLSQGGEVVIASRNEIPKGRPILAILDDDGEDLEKSEDLPQHQVYHRGLE